MVVIIGVLAAIAIPIFAKQREAVVQVSVKSDVRNNVGGIYSFLAANQTLNNVTISSTDPVDILKPKVISTTDNYVEIVGSRLSFTVLVTNAANTINCEFQSDTGHLTCNY